MSGVPLRGVCILLDWDGKRSTYGESALWSNALLKAWVPLLILCLEDPCVDGSRVGRPPALTVLVSISPFTVVAVAFYIAGILYWVHIGFQFPSPLLGLILDRYVMTFFVSY